MTNEISARVMIKVLNVSKDQSVVNINLYLSRVRSICKHWFPHYKLWSVIFALHIPLCLKNCARVARPSFLCAGDAIHPALRWERSGSRDYVAHILVIVQEYSLYVCPYTCTKSTLDL